MTTEKKTANTVERARRMHEQHKGGMSFADIGKMFNVSRATAARGVKAHRDKLHSQLNAHIDGKK